MNIKDISFLGKALSPMGEVLTFIFLMVLVLSFLAYLFKDSLKELIKKKSKKKRNYDDLKYHSVFNIAKNFPSKVKNIDFTTHSQYDPTKTRLLHKLLEFKSNSIDRHLSKLLKRDDISTMNPNQLRQVFSSLLMDMIKEYNEESLMFFVSEYKISHEDARSLIDKYEEYRYYLVEGFADSVDEIALDPYMDDNFMKLNSIFYLIGLSLEVIPNGVKRVFNDINGRFKKYDIKN